MLARRRRFVVVAVLVAVGLGAGLLMWDAQRRIAELARAAHDTDTRLNRMMATALETIAAQQAYVAPGQPESQWLERFSALIQQLTDDAAAARQRARAQDTAAALNAVNEGLGALVQVDGRARENLNLGQELIAADLIFADARQTLDAIASQLRTARDAERAAFAGEQASAARQAWVVLGAAALAWLGGLVLLARAPKVEKAGDAPADVPASLPRLEPQPALPDSIGEPAQRDGTPPRTPLDLAAAADVCTAMSRLTSTVELPDLLARASAALDASGIIVWMSAGEELFAVTAHGYDPRVISRLGPIGRHTDNVTAACWRRGEITTFSGDMISNGAIVAPMFGPDACIGVLAAEVRHGREADADARAVASMFAAQLATAVAAWPAASTAVSDAPPAAATGS